MVKRLSLFSFPQVFYVCIIVVVVALTFLPGLGGEFLNWDDTSHVLANPSIQSFDIPEMFHQKVQKIYIPLTTFSFAIDYKFFGFNSFAYHFNNLVLHVLNCVLVFVFAQRLGLTVFAAFWTALIFGVHPMKVESVAWVTERKDLLYSFFYLLAMLLYCGYLRSKSWWMYAGFILCAVLSLLSKPMALSLLFIVFLLDWFYRRDFTFKTVIEKIPVLLLFVPITWMTYVLHARNPINNLIEAVLMWTYSFSFYLVKFVWPDILVPVYQIPKPVSFVQPTYFSFFVIFILVGASLVLLRKLRWWLFAACFYFLSIFFLLRFDPVNDIHVVADRFMYLPCLGFCLLIGIGIAKLYDAVNLAQNPKWVMLKFLPVIVLIFLACKSMEQTKVWNNSVSLWTHVILHNPKLFLAYNDRAVAYNDKNLYDLALSDYNAILKFDPTNVDVFYNRGLLLKKIGRYEDAIDDFTRVIMQYPRFEKAYDHRGMSYEALNQFHLALKDYTRAVTVSPAYADGYMNRGNIYNKQGELKDALADYEMVISLEPSNVKAVNNRGTVYAKMFDNVRAMADFNKAIEMDPKHAESYYNRSVIHVRMNNFKLAFEDALSSRSYGAEVDSEYIQDLQKAMQ